MKIKGSPEVYILGAVVVVAVVGVLSLLMTGSSNNLTGQAVGDPTCTDTDGGLAYTTQGTITGGTWKTTGATYADKTDSCVKKGKYLGKLLEGYCSDSTHGFYKYVDCATVVGAGYVCISGACVLDSDGDGVPDATDVCPGYDDADDADGDGIPDGCDTATDSDGDGVADTDDVCAGYDDAVDTDSDGTPDGCDDDDDGDGYSDADEAAAGTDPLDASDYPVPVSYPDLEIIALNAVRINQSNGNISVNFTLNNNGIGDIAERAYVGSSLVANYIDTAGSSQSTNTGVKFVYNYPQSLRAGSSITVKTYAGLVTSDVIAAIASGSSYSLDITITADYIGSITESDEMNNIYTQTVTVTSADFIECEWSWQCASGETCEYNRCIS